MLASRSAFAVTSVLSLLSLAGGCNKHSDGDTLVLCCLDYTYPGPLGPLTITHCDHTTCPNGVSNENEICSDFCPPNNSLWEEIGYPIPANATSVRMTSCHVNTGQTENWEGVGETGGNEFCGSNSAPSDPGDYRSQGAVYALAFDQASSGDLDITVGTHTQTPDYSGTAEFYLSDCRMDAHGTTWCDLTLRSLSFETSSDMIFGHTIVPEAKGLIINSLTTSINMDTGAFVFSGKDIVTVGVAWQEAGGPLVEKARRLSNGNTSIVGTLRTGSAPSVSFDATFTHSIAGGTGSVDLNGIRADITNQPPVADETNTASVVTCIPSSIDPHMTRVVLDAGASFDPESNIGGYVWTVDDTVEAFGPDAETAVVSLAPGIHDVELDVYDKDGAWSEVSFMIDVDDPTGACW
jgi:hypothetical protein